MSSHQKNRQQTGVADPAPSGPGEESHSNGGRPLRKEGTGSQPDGGPSPTKNPVIRRAVWVIATLAALLIVGAIGWRLHRRAPAPAPPAMVGVSISPEEA